MKTFYECYRCKGLSEDKPIYARIVGQLDTGAAMLVVRGFCKRCYAVAATNTPKEFTGFRAV